MSYSDSKRDELSRIYADEAARLLAFTMFSDDDGDYQNPVFGKGDVNAKIVFIGEAPGANEVIEKTPFVGKAGKQLDELLELAKIDRESVFVTNAVKFRPYIKKEGKTGRVTVSNRKPTTKEMEDGNVTLTAELAILAPKIVVTLGNTPLSAVLEISHGFAESTRTIGTLHGRAYHIACGDNSFSLFPMYHPASVIYNRALKETALADAVRLGEFVRQVESNRKE